MGNTMFSLAVLVCAVSCMCCTMNSMRCVLYASCVCFLVCTSLHTSSMRDRVRSLQLNHVRSWRKKENISRVSSGIPKRNMLTHKTYSRNILQCLAVYCSVLQCVAVCCSVLPCVAVCCTKHVAFRVLRECRHLRSTSCMSIAHACMQTPYKQIKIFIYICTHCTHCVHVYYWWRYWSM